MHEMALCESIRSIIEEQARSQHFRRVERVCLEVGPMAGVEVAALRFGFDAVMAGSIAAGAALEIEEPAGEAWCMPCGETVPVNSRADACPRCGSHQLQIVAGTQLRIKALEVN